MMAGPQTGQSVEHGLFAAVRSHPHARHITLSSSTELRREGDDEDADDADDTDDADDADDYEEEEEEEGRSFLAGGPQGPTLG